MKKKGFTLVELMATMIVLGIIMIIAVPVITNSLKNSRNRAYALQVSRIKEQAKNWATANTDHLPDTEAGYAFVSVSDLRALGFIKDEDVLDPRSQNVMEGCVSIRYDASNNQYIYEYHDETCNELKQETFDITFTIEGIYDNEDKKDRVEVNTPYVFPTVTAVNSQGQSLTVQGPIIKQKGQGDILNTLDTSGTAIDRVYDVVYTAFDYANGVESDVTIEVTVIDTTPPILVVDGHTSSYEAVHEAGQTFTTPAYEASDNSNLPNVPTVDITGNVNVYVPGTYQVTYVASDTKQNRTSMIVTVTVVDTTKPVIASVTGNPSSWTKNNVTLTINASDSGSGLHATAYSCNGGSTWQAENTCTVSSNQTVNIAVRDKVGNYETTSVTVNKIDKTAPVITVDGHTSSYSITRGRRSSYTIPTGTATDNVTSPVTVNRSGSVTPNVNGTYTVTYTASDEATNTTTLTLTVNVVDPTYSAWMTETEVTNAGHSITEEGIQSKTQYGYQDVNTWSSSYSTTVPSDGYYTSTTQYRYKTKSSSSGTAECEQSNSGTYWGTSNGDGGCATGQKVCDHTCNRGCYTRCAEGICTQPGATGVWRLHYYCSYSTESCGGWGAWGSGSNTGCGSESRTVYAGPASWKTATGWRDDTAYTKTTSRKPVTRTVYRYQTN